MSLSEIIAELPLLTEEERREVIERALELDDFSDEEMKLLEDRFAAHQRDPSSSLPWEKMLARLNERRGL